MLLRVQNLGPIREAELDLGKPLIVLTGPNSSGKTYLAWAAYSLARLNLTTVEPPPSLHAWVDRLLGTKDYTLSVDSLLEQRHDILRALADAVQKQLPEDFAAKREQFSATRFELSDSPEGAEALRTLKGLHVTRYEDYSLALAFPAEGRLRLHIYDQTASGSKEFSVSDLDEERLDRLKAGIAKIGLYVVVGALLDRRYVAFPVERLAINLFSRELAARRTELVDELLSEASAPDSPVDLRDKLQRRAGQYPLAIRDAIQTALRVPTKGADFGPLADLADELEESVLGGSIKSTAHEDLEFIPHQDPSKAPIGLHQSASVVKSLVSLVLHLRYEGQPGQRLVIDEPELNLHPDNQRRVVRVLAKAVNRGLKIMMSTHSDYVIRELNNLVMLGQGSDEAQELQRELGYQADQTLRPEQIGAYLVNDGTCTPLESTPTGFETKTIEDEIHKLNHDAQTIYLRLFCE